MATKPSRAELNLRAMALVPYLISHQPDAEVAIIPGRNVRLDELPTAEELGMPLPEPSIEHSVATCAPCGTDIWLGPRQLKARGVRMCYLCAAIADQMISTGDNRTEYRALNPHADDVPRRRTT